MNEGVKQLSFSSVNVVAAQARINPAHPKNKRRNDESRKRLKMPERSSSKRKYAPLAASTHCEMGYKVSSKSNVSKPNCWTLDWVTVSAAGACWVSAQSRVLLLEAVCTAAGGENASEEIEKSRNAVDEIFNMIRFLGAQCGVISFGRFQFWWLSLRYACVCVFVCMFECLYVCMFVCL